MKITAAEEEEEGGRSPGAEGPGGRGGARSVQQQQLVSLSGLSGSESRGGTRDDLMMGTSKQAEPSALFSSWG